MTVAARRDRPLTDAARRALVRSAVGPMVYRLDAAAVAMIAADCAGLDARAAFARAAAWGRACRVALDAGQPLPAALPLDVAATLADAADAAGASPALPRDDAPAADVEAVAVA